MKKDKGNFHAINLSRRGFIKKAGASVAGLFIVPYIKPSGVFAYSHKLEYVSTVAVTNTLNKPANSYIYDDAEGGIKQTVQYLFEQIGGISDLFSNGKKVVIKINLTGGSGNATNDKLNGVPVTEAMWSHPAVVQAVTELIIDAGVNAGDIIIAESLGLSDSFDKSVFQGYVDIKNSYGCELMDISKGDFVEISTGDNYYNYSSLIMNKVLQDADVFVSVPKLKQHAEAGFTGAIKNQVGAVPQSEYETESIAYRRQALHNPTNGSSATYLPGSICDLNAARPVHLAIVDGIKNAKGGEGVWNPNFVPFESHVMLAGKDPVATDSIGSYLMGLDCEAKKFQLPGDNGYGDTECDNYLDHLYARGVGTNQLSEINVVGDGKDLISAINERVNIQKPVDFKLCANYPNPFNPSTMIVFYLPHSAYVTLKVYDIRGREVETLIEGEVPSGEHRIQWSAKGLASGIYLGRLEAKGFSEAIRMIYQK